MELIKTNKLWILLGILIFVIAIVLAIVVSTPPQQKPQPDTPPKWNDTPNSVSVDVQLVWKGKPAFMAGF
ncbi:hypothetical protein MFMK1_000062 [Metallumcola ferriviriculae]|uniref:Uncharacterized protein n=1 Tax=Metallumcola ferriviriculae TaxID=3039180 RepID=A0AAU0UHC0_9FIRM|nr:hypothetical protein MFMK1_000062 [Desulfitibacteraceae bacterium MK1]